LVDLFQNEWSIQASKKDTKPPQKYYKSELYDLNFGIFQTQSYFMALSDDPNITNKSYGLL